MTAPAPLDAGEAAQRDAEAHLAACNAAEEAYEETGDLAHLEASPAVGPGCMACDTCTVREVLAAGWPHLLAHAADLIAEHLPVLTDAGASAAMKLLRAEARRSALPSTVLTHGEGVRA